MTHLAAAPRPVQRVLGEAAANRIVEDVAAGVFQVRVPVDQAGVEPLLEEMAGSAVASVEPSRVSTVQRVHSARQVLEGRGNDDVVMVRHKAERVEAQRPAPSDVSEERRERVAVDREPVEGSEVTSPKQQPRR